MSDSQGAPAARPMRADARRNRERIVAAAETVVAEHGAEASLEEVARRAGVGSATLHRHFPTRQSLLEAVFMGRVDALCARGRELLPDPDPGAALVTWLRAVATHSVVNRGLGVSLMREAGGAAAPLGRTCHALITGAGDELLARAHAVGAVRPDVTATQLLRLVGAIALATEEAPDGAAEADRLLTLAIEGVRAR